MENTQEIMIRDAAFKASETILDLTNMQGILWVLSAVSDDCPVSCIRDAVTTAASLLEDYARQLDECNSNIFKALRNECDTVQPAVKKSDVAVAAIQQ